MDHEPTYKFAIEELSEAGHLCLTVFTFELPSMWLVTDIIEGPYVFIINKLTSYYDDTRRLRKVK